ncbi:SPOSA6832_01249 [Sporobolomyces salmonicolor]|uniref:SPOSA6832_01249-mRNA-1:cds n=1 Tax=Sporidiobolus salmonicolor TaxID=5005 RepID=A0A0D6EI86_SPOSA|nr:SPOSA6832_01249 [Sporobolomyces salmonicolor]
MMRRFWKTVAVEKRPEGEYAVLLDHRTLKTPGGAPLLMPKDRLPVSLLIAEEWENQVAVLKPHTLPMTSLAARALDGLKDENTRKEVVASLLKYLDTDTFPATLVKLQEAHWKPLIDWVCKTYDVEIRIYEGILNTRQPDATILKLGSVVADYDQFKLAAFERAVLASKSYLVALGLVEGFLSADDAAHAAHVEVQSQINRWGEVEDSEASFLSKRGRLPVETDLLPFAAHDVDHQDVRVRLGSAALLCAVQPQLVSA